MANDAGLDIRTRFEELANHANLEVLVPRSSEIDAGALLLKKLPDDLIRAASRRNYFFDENATLTLLLKAHTEEANLRALLSKLEIAVLAHATDSTPREAGNASAPPPTKHDLTSKTISAAEPDEIIAIDEYVYVLWRPSLHLVRPRARLQRPAVYFTATITVAAAALTAAQRSRQEFLASYETLPRNVLEPLQFDLALRDSNILLSETRVTKVAPAAADPRGDLLPIRGASKRAFPISPALYTKIRYSTLTDAVVASLHIETSTTGPRSVIIDQVRLDVPDAIVEDISRIPLPCSTSGGDETVVLQKLRRKPAIAETDRSTLTVNIEAKASADDDGDVPITVSWQTQVNLLQVTAKPSYRWSRPSAAPTTTQQSSRTTLQTISPTGMADGTTAPAMPSAGSKVIFSFTAAPTTKTNEELQLKVQCINRSGRPRSFGLVGLQPRHASAKPHHVSPSSEPAHGKVPTTMVEKILKAPSPERRKPLDVTDLNPDLRFGPVAAGASYETSMRFSVLASGVLDLGGVRIVDLDTKQMVDVRQLPEVIALSETT